MKKILLTLALIVVTTVTYAQGTIQMANTSGTRFLVNGVRPLSVSAGGPAAGTYVFGVFAGTSADALSQVPLGELGRNTVTGGLISSSNPQAHAVPGFGPFSQSQTKVFIQIRGWEASFADDWRAAQASGLFGESAVRSFELGAPSGPGAVIWGSDTLTQFQAINLVPEPSSIALAVLGLGSLLLFRRRK